MRYSECKATALSALVLICLFFSIGVCRSVAQQKTDTLRLVEKELFLITACHSDVLFVNRPTPCLALMHDTLFVFSTYKDTLAFFDMQGRTVRKVHHHLGYPSYLYYNNKRGRLYFLNIGIEGEKKKTHIYELDSTGVLQDSVVFTGNWEKWWLVCGAIEQSTIQKIVPLLRKYNVGGKRHDITVEALSDIQTLWNDYVIAGRRDGANKKTMIALTDKTRRYYTIGPLPPLSTDSTCEKPNHVWTNLYNLRRGYCTTSKGELVYVWQGYSVFGFSVLSIKD